MPSVGYPVALPSDSVGITIRIESESPFVFNRNRYSVWIGITIRFQSEYARTRSGCFFCFYQQKVEWVMLKETHPDLFEQAKSYEKPGKDGANGPAKTFYWCGDEPLEELEKPERMEQIKRENALAREKARLNAPNKKLIQILGGIDTEYEEQESCLICHL